MPCDARPPDDRPGGPAAGVPPHERMPALPAGDPGGGRRDATGQQPLYEGGNPPPDLVRRRGPLNPRHLEELVQKAVRVDLRAGRFPEELEDLHDVPIWIADQD